MSLTAFLLRLEPGLLLDGFAACGTAGEVRKVARLDWTGERFLPWMDNAKLAWEHLHRYAFCSPLVEGRRVLDLASGEGYGSQILARSARFVVGIDDDAAAVGHASDRYAGSGLAFCRASMDAIPASPASFDAVVCFEAIEHVDGHARVISEIRRVLAPGGLCILSTPDKSVYRSVEGENPHHVAELTLGEFERLAGAAFEHVRMFGQRVHPQSRIWPLGARGARGAVDFTGARQDGGYVVQPGSDAIPLYAIAVASDSEIPEDLLFESILTDTGDEMIREKESAVARLLEGQASDREAILWQSEQLQHARRELQASNEACDREIDRLRSELDKQAEVLKQVFGSWSWKLTAPVRRLRKAWRA